MVNAKHVQKEQLQISHSHTAILHTSHLKLLIPHTSLLRLLLIVHTSHLRLLILQLHYNLLSVIPLKSKTNMVIVYHAQMVK